MSLFDFADFNGDGEVDELEQIVGLEMLCTSREEHEELFGDSENYDGDDDFDF